MQTITVPDAVAEKLTYHTGKRTTRAAVVAIADTLPDVPGIVLVEGKREYRATAALLAAIAKYDRADTRPLTDAEFEKATGIQP